LAKQYGLVFDLLRCIGCHTCTIACKVENELEHGSWISVRTIGGKYMDTPSGKYPNLSMHYRPELCNHCREPACIPACPVNAISKTDEGIVLVDYETCTGCGECIDACPYDAPKLDNTKGVVMMCTLCVHRLEQGLEPFCVKCCPTNAIHFGEIDNPESEISKLIREKKAEGRTSKKNTHPSIFYIPQ
jgi:Fe-S-cluster-containing dehydrogenase component